MNRIAQQIARGMDLRKPQIEALSVLAKAVESLPMESEANALEVLKQLQREFPQVADFERDFPNLCFTLATGVGKTRLMGAMIAYLASEKQVRDFFIVAPNHTILEKLVREFSDPNDPKYVFRGVGQFNAPPKIITSENFDEGYGVRSDWASEPELFGAEDVHIYLFNISMFNSRERRIKTPRETIVGGMSYFEYLSKLKKLVVFMDEAHRYRAENSSQAIGDLKPILGIELTATPQVEMGNRTVLFKNVIYGYSLAQALDDGYVKEPWVAGRENFKSVELDEEMLERLKLEDGIRIHEATKIHLKNYCHNSERRPIKPFILVIASSIKHANELEALMKSEAFFEGRYRDKIRVVHSGSKPEEEERAVRDLLEIESITNPIEVVIHVNKLREGWDVVNLYTIVPLRAANSKTLIEQSLGRGLRLPFGQRTGKTEVDRLTIVSHDRFDEIVSEAKRSNSLIRQSYQFGTSDLPENGFETVAAEPKFMEEMNGYGKASQLVAQKTVELMEKTGEKSSERLAGMVAPALGEPEETIKPLVEDILKRYEALSIRIPRITVMPEVIRPGKYRPFRLDVQQISLQHSSSGIIMKNLSTGEMETIMAARTAFMKESSEDFLAGLLLNDDSVSETEENAEAAIDLARQMVDHLHSYLGSEENVQAVIAANGAMLAEYILAQMKEHYEPPVEKFSSTVGRDFTFLKSVYHTQTKGSDILRFDEPPDQLSLISKALFKGFSKSTYPIVQFDSNSERLFACVLEQDSSVLKWVKTPAKSLTLYYQRNLRYEPDFIVETASGFFLCEVKSSAELQDPIVLQKKEAAVHWCEEATIHAQRHETKPWVYCLIPHSEVSLTTTFASLATRFQEKRRRENLYFLQAKGIAARGILENGRFVVLQGSEVYKEETNSLQSCYRDLRKSLCSGGIIAEHQEVLRFVEDYAFASPSTASSILLGASSNGRAVWKNQQGQTLKEA